MQTQYKFDFTLATTTFVHWHLITSSITQETSKHRHSHQALLEVTTTNMCKILYCYFWLDNKKLS